jgi:hypothetical protein
MDAILKKPATPDALFREASRTMRGRRWTMYSDTQEGLAE